MPAARKSVTNAQIRDDPAALVDLLERLPREEWKARRAAVSGLARLVLEGRDLRPATRRDVPREGLKAVTPADALALLSRVAMDELEHEDVRWRAGNVLGDHGNETVVEALAGMLRASSKYLRKEAANALLELGEAAGESPLIDALADPERDVRAAAARALGRVGSRRAVQRLAERAAGDDKLFVRQEALAALAAMGTPEARGAAEHVLAGASGLTRWRLRRWMERES